MLRQVFPLITSSYSVYFFQYSQVQHQMPLVMPVQAPIYPENLFARSSLLLLPNTNLDILLHPFEVRKTVFCAGQTRQSRQ